ncbi:sensor histidine kinase [Aerococcus sanguinicola]|uniref:sensor histidine kinase n=1 Tax=Aerococcus sanguinicola TaxID=119206 RepID=UPI0018A7A307|nr:histidine kinase [Aerococcus sanguinicola]
MAQTFRESLERDMVRIGTLLVVLVSTILVLVFMAYAYIEQTTQLRRDTEGIAAAFADDLAGADRVLEAMLAAEGPGRDLSYRFYRTQADNHLEGQVFLLDGEGEEVYNNAPDRPLPASYRQLLAGGEGEAGRLTYFDVAGQPYLMVYRRQPDKLAVYLIKGQDLVQADRIDAVSYILLNPYSRVLASDKSANLDHVAGRGHFAWVNNQVYLRQQTPLASGFQLQTQILFLPILSLLAISLAGLLLLILFMVGLTNHFAAYLAKHNSQAIDSLVGETRRISQGDQERLEGDYEADFAYLAQAMNLMLARIRQRNADQIDLERDRVNYERKMLEAQFNPHFLYNTLETIRITSQFDPKVCSQLIRSLTTILRYSMGGQMADAALAEDLKVIDHYLQVTQVRFPQFSYAIHCPEALGQVQVPRLFLLSAIENAIKYGRDQRPDLRIDLTVDCEEDQVFFCLADNGPGFSQEARAHLAADLAANRGQHGLMNSIKRLHFLYPEAQLEVKDSDEGACLIYWIRRPAHVPDCDR